MTTVRALGTGISVEIADDTPLAHVARAIIAPYPPAQSAELHYELRSTQLSRNGTAIEIEDPRDVVPAFELDLYREIVARAPPGWLLHAAAIDVDGHALVLCGPSGAGKTTLAMALAARGYRLLTEEIVWLGRDGSVRGLPRSLHVIADSLQRARLPPTWRQVPYPMRDRNNEIRQHILVVPPGDSFQLGERPLRAIVRIGHGPDWNVHLEPSPAHIALPRLWDRSLRRDDDGLAVATALLRHYPSYVLSTRSETEAVALLDPLLK